MVDVVLFVRGPINRSRRWCMTHRRMVLIIATSIALALQGILLQVRSTARGLFHVDNVVASHLNQTK
jgi:hypothetical protein